LTFFLFHQHFLFIKNAEEQFRLKLFAAKWNQFLWCLNCSYAYFIGRQNLHPLLIAYFWRLLKLQSTREIILWTEMSSSSTFYSMFTNFLNFVTFLRLLTFFYFNCNVFHLWHLVGHKAKINQILQKKFHLATVRHIWSFEPRRT